MKIALVFPGQGSQIVGMCSDFYNLYGSAKEVFNILDDRLNRPLSSLIFSGSKDELNNTINAQPSIMAASIAVYNAIIEEGLIKKDDIKCVAGHSLGEYSALVANKSISIEDSIDLLDVRSRAMQESMPVGTGGMAALIGKTIQDIEKILPEISSNGKIYIANDNANGQVVLSGEIKAIDFICVNYREFGIKKAIKLPVSAPFHCDLIDTASVKLEIAMKDKKFKEFIVPLYSNVTAEPCNSLDIKELLVRQVVSRVKWRETIQNMVRDGIDNFIEIGPGGILTNLIKRINKDVTAISISSVEDLKKLD
tara:strand:+ start:1104 stop:2030 length:927 start_codon:yes stop_codon:yes gene_type:complete